MEPGTDRVRCVRQALRALTGGCSCSVSRKRRKSRATRAGSRRTLANRGRAEPTANRRRKQPSKAGQSQIAEEFADGDRRGRAERSQAKQTGSGRRVARGSPGRSPPATGSRALAARQGGGPELPGRAPEPAAQDRHRCVACPRQGWLGVWRRKAFKDLRRRWRSIPAGWRRRSAAVDESEPPAWQPGKSGGRPAAERKVTDNVRIWSADAAAGRHARHAVIHLSAEDIGQSQREAM